MVIRKASAAAFVCMLTAAIAVGQNQGTSYLFQLPGAGSGASNVVGYVSTANPLRPTVNFTGPAGAYQIIPKPDGTRFYVLATGPGNPAVPALQIFNSTFSTFTTINGLGAPPTALAMAPDGKHVVVAAGNVYVVDSTTDQIVGNSLPLSGTVAGMVVSPDSSTVYILINSNTGSQVVAFSLLTQTVVGTALTLTAGGTAISMSPLGLLYATSVNRIFEIDPSTMQTTANGVIQLTASPGPFRFTPDGTTAYFVNQTPNIGGNSLFQMTLDSNHTLVAWPGSNTAPVLNDVYVAGNGRIFTLAAASGVVYDVAPASLAVTPSILTSVFGGTGVLALAVSNELPNAAFLFALVNIGTYAQLERIDLSTNLIVVQQLPVANTGSMSYVTVPPESGAGGFLTFNANQTLTASATSAPLLARILDATGRPLFNEPYSFSAPAGSGLVINTPTGVTNSDGDARTTVGMPATPGVYTVTLTAESANAAFTLTIPGGINGNPGGGTSSQMTIVSGDGQLVIQNNIATFPLVVQVTDSTGAPLQGKTVNFALDAAASSAVFPLQVSTDQNGLASTFYQGAVPFGGQSFETDTVVASSSVGTVTFTETSTATILNDPTNGLPNIVIDEPSQNTTPPNTVTLALGTPLPNAIVAEIYSAEGLNIGSPFPGVGITVVNPDDPFARDPATYPVPASCQGSSNSDKNGIARCTMLASCQAGTGLFSFAYWVGGIERFTNNYVQITRGAPSKLTIVNGNNQNGTAGQTLSTALSASISDGCGGLVPAGVPVTWAVTQGSATLLNTVNQSNSNGQVSTSVTLGQAAGVVKVTVSLTGTSQTATFTLTDQITVTAMNIVSGNNQTTFTTQAFAQPLVARVIDSGSHGVPGIVVNFAPTAGSVQLADVHGNAATTATTDSSGNATIYATAGSTAGPISILASYSTFAVTFTLTSQPQGPSITAASFQNAAYSPLSKAGAALAPCGLASVQGGGLATGLQGTVQGSLFGPLSLALNGVGLTVNGVGAPIYSVSNVNGVQQVIFQTPCETVPGPATVIVTVNGGTTSVPNVPVSQAQPGIYNYISNNKPYGWVLDSNGNTVTVANPAKRGGTYFIVVTGLGQTNPALGTNSIGEFGVAQTVNLTVLAGANVYGVPMLDAQYLFGTVGMYLVEFQIPANFPVAATGLDQNLVIAVLVGNQEVFSNSVLLPSIQP